MFSYNNTNAFCLNTPSQNTWGKPTQSLQTPSPDKKTRFTIRSTGRKRAFGGDFMDSPMRGFKRQKFGLQNQKTGLRSNNIVSFATTAKKSLRPTASQFGAAKPRMREVQTCPRPPAFSRATFSRATAMDSVLASSAKPSFFKSKSQPLKVPKPTWSVPEEDVSFEYNQITPELSPAATPELSPAPMHTSSSSIDPSPVEQAKRSGTPENLTPEYSNFFKPADLKKGLRLFPHQLFFTPIRRKTPDSQTLSEMSRLSEMCDPVSFDEITCPSEYESSPEPYCYDSDDSLDSLKFASPIHSESESSCDDFLSRINSCLDSDFSDDGSVDMTDMTKLTA